MHHEDAVVSVTATPLAVEGRFPKQAIQTTFWPFLTTVHVVVQALGMQGAS